MEGTVKFIGEFDSSLAEQQIEQFRKKLETIKIDIPASAIGSITNNVKKLNSAVIVPKVDHKPLTDLNKHLDKKVSHVKQVNAYLRANPLKVAFAKNEHSISINEGNSRSGNSNGASTYLIESKLDTIIDLLQKNGTALAPVPVGVAPPVGIGAFPSKSVAEATQAIQGGIGAIQSVGKVILRLALILMAKQYLSGALIPFTKNIVKTMATVLTAVDVKKKMSSLPSSNAQPFSPVSSNKNTSQDAKKIGKDTTEGIGKGLDKNAVEQQGQSVGFSLLKGIKQFLHIKSPSKKTKDVIAKNVILGLKEGFATTEIEQIGSYGAKQLVKGMKQSLRINSASQVMRDVIGKNAVLGIKEGFQELPKVLDDVKNTVATAMSDIQGSIDMSQPIQSLQSVVGTTRNNLSTSSSNTTISDELSDEQLYMMNEAHQQATVIENRLKTPTSDIKNVIGQQIKEVEQEIAQQIEGVNFSPSLSSLPSESNIDLEDVIKNADNQVSQVVGSSNIPFKADIKKMQKEFITEVSLLAKAIKTVTNQVKQSVSTSSPDKPSQRNIPLTETVADAMGTANFAYNMSAENKQEFADRKTANIQKPSTMSALEGASNDIKQNLEDIEKDVVIVIDGLSADAEQAQKDIESWASKTFQNAQVFSEKLDASNISAKDLADPVKKAQAVLNNFNKFYTQGEINPDALKMAARILAIAKKAPNKKITAVGRGVGGNVVQEALFILQQAGYGDVTKNVKGYGMGTVKIEPYNTPNYTARTSKYSTTRAFGVTEQGNLDFYKLIKENFIKAVIVNPAIIAASLAFPAYGVPRAGLAIANRIRRRSKVVSRGMGDEEFIADINQNISGKATNIGKTLETLVSPVTAIAGILGKVPLINMVANPINRGVQGTVDLVDKTAQFVASEEEIIKQRTEDRNNVVKETKKYWTQLEEVQTLGIGSIFSFLKGAGTRLVSAFAVFSTASIAFQFLFTIPDQIERLGFAFARLIEPVKKMVNALANSSTAFDKVAKTSVEMGISMEVLANGYQDFLLLARSKNISQGQAETITFDLAQISTNYGLQMPDQQAVFDSFQQLFANVDRVDLDSFNQLEKRMPGIIESLKASTNTDNLNELVEGINTGQVDKNQTLLNLIEKLKIESASFRDVSMSTAIQKENELLAQTQTFQATVADEAVEFYTFTLGIQKLGVQILTQIIPGLQRVIEMLGVGFSVATIATFIALIKTLRTQLTAPMLAGTNLFDRFYDAATVISPRVGRLVPLLGRATIAVKSFVSAFGPLMLVSAILTSITGAFSDFNAKSEEAAQTMAKLKEAVKLVEKQPEPETVKTIPQQVGNYIKNVWSPVGYATKKTLGDINPFGKDNVVYDIAKMFKNTKFDSVSGNQKTSFALKELPLEEISKMEDYRKSLDEVFNLFSTLKQNSDIFNMDISSASLKEVEDQIDIIDSKIKGNKINLAKAISSGDYKTIGILKTLINDLETEKRKVLTNNFGNTNALSTFKEQFEQDVLEIESVLANVSLDPISFDELLNKKDRNKLEQEALLKIESIVSLQGFKSLEDYNNYIKKTQKSLTEVNQVLEIYNNTLNKNADNLKKIEANIRKINIDRLNFTFGQSNQVTKANTSLNTQRAKRQITEYDFNKSQMDIRLSANSANRQNLSTQQDELKQLIKGFSVANLEGFKTAFDIKGDIFQSIENNPSFSPDGLRESLNNFKDSDGKIDSALETTTNQVAKYLEAKGELLKSEEEYSQILLEQQNLLKQRTSEVRDFQRQLVDLDLTIADYFRQRERGIIDFAWQIEDASIQYQRQQRDLVESYLDMNRQLVLQTAQIDKTIKETSLDISKRTLMGELRKNLGFGGQGLFGDFYDAIDQFLQSQNDIKIEELSFEEQRLQIQEDMVALAKQIRGLQEQMFDMERQRIKQLIDLMKQQEDWIIQQKASWLGITRQVEDMERQAKEMGIAFTSIAKHLDGINGSYATIHKAIAQMASDVKKSADDFSTSVANSNTGSSDASNVANGNLGKNGFFFPVPDGYIPGGREDHAGVDIYGKRGDKIYSPFSGTIVYDEEGHTRNSYQDVDPVAPGFQKQRSIKIELDTPVIIDGKEFKYAYMTHFMETQGLAPGTKVQAGDYLGKMGWANEWHLHFGLFPDKFSDIGAVQDFRLQKAIKEWNGSLRGTPISNQRPSRDQLELQSQTGNTQTSSVGKGGTRTKGKLTFNDGPNPQITPQVLDQLKATGQKATFYLVGAMVDAYPELVQRIYKEGHTLGVHSYTHRDLTKLSASDVEKELRFTRDAINNAIRKVDPSYKGVQQFRAPYGETNSSVNSTARNLGLTSAQGWDVDTNDWRKSTTAGEIKQKVQGATQGQVILLHDGNALMDINNNAKLQLLIKQKFPGLDPVRPDHREASPSRQRTLDSLRSSNLNFDIPKEVEVKVALAGVSDIPFMDQLNIPDTLHIPTVLDVDNSQLVAQRLPEKTNYRDEEWANIKTARDAIIWTAKKLQVNTRDLAALASFESGTGNFSTSNMGGTNNQYMGWMQLSPDARKKLGVQQGASQQDYALAVVRYFKEFRAKPLKPGASLQEIYNEINPGFGNVRPKLENGGHFNRADKLLGNNFVEGSTGMNAQYSIPSLNLPNITPVNQPDLTAPISKLSSLVEKMNPTKFSQGTPWDVTIANPLAIGQSLLNVLPAVTSVPNTEAVKGAMSQNQMVSKEELQELMKLHSIYNGQINTAQLEINGNALIAKKIQDLQLRQQQQYSLKLTEAQRQGALALTNALYAQADTIRQQLETYHNINKEVKLLSLNAKGYLLPTEQIGVALTDISEKYRNQRNSILTAQREMNKLVQLVQKAKDSPMETMAENLALVFKDERFLSFPKELQEELKAKFIEGGAGLVDGVIQVQKMLDEFPLMLDEVNLNEQIELTATAKVISIDIDANAIQNLQKLTNEMMDGNAIFDPVRHVGLSKIAKRLEISGRRTDMDKFLKVEVEKATGTLNNEQSTPRQIQDARDLLALAEEYNERVEQLGDAIYNKASREIDKAYLDAIDQRQSEIFKNIGEKQKEQNPFGGGSAYFAEAERLDIALRYRDQLNKIKEMEESGLYDPQFIAKLEEQVRAMEEMDLSKVEEKFNIFAQAIREPLQQAFSSMFTDVVKGTKSIGDVLLQFLDSVASFFANLAAQMVTNQVMGWFKQLGMFAVGAVGGAIGGGIGLSGGGSMDLGGLSAGTAATDFVSANSYSIASGINIAGMYNGGEVEKIANFADGGLVGGIYKAMQKEGFGAVPIVAHIGEQVLTDRNGDAQLFRQLEANGEWNRIKQDFKYNGNNIRNFSYGGTVGNVNTPTMRTPQGNSQGAVYNYAINVTTKDADSFRKSKSLIAQEQKLMMERNNRFT